MLETTDDGYVWAKVYADSVRALYFNMSQMLPDHVWGTVRSILGGDQKKDGRHGAALQCLFWFKLLKPFGEVADDKLIARLYAVVESHPKCLAMYMTYVTRQYDPEMIEKIAKMDKKTAEATEKHFHSLNLADEMGIDIAWMYPEV